MYVQDEEFALTKPVDERHHVRVTSALVFSTTKYLTRLLCLRYKHLGKHAHYLLPTYILRYAYHEHIRIAALRWKQRLMRVAT